MRRKRGGPGVLGTMAQTAVIAGTASVTMNAVNSKGAAKQQAAQQQAAAAQAAVDEAAATQARIAALEQQATAAVPAPAAVEAAAAPAGDDIIARLQQVAELHKAGILNDVEFEQAKARILAG
ncbi:MAG: SHOCT domain-containing protein [Thermomicrobiales bacterium]